MTNKFFLFFFTVVFSSYVSIFSFAKEIKTISDMVDNIKNNTNEKTSLVQKKCSKGHDLEDEWVGIDDICKQAPLANLKPDQKVALENKLVGLKIKKEKTIREINACSEKDSFVFRCNNLRRLDLSIREIECKLGKSVS